MCTKTSFEPSSGRIKPKPLLVLKNLTVPVGMVALQSGVARHDTVPGIKLLMGGDQEWRPQAGIVDGPTANSTCALCGCRRSLQGVGGSKSRAWSLRAGGAPAGGGGRARGVLRGASERGSCDRAPRPGGGGAEGA